MLHLNFVIKIFLLLLCLQQVAFAGVVEDAEEELKKLRGDGEAVHLTVSPSDFSSEQRTGTSSRSQASSPTDATGKHRQVDSKRSGSSLESGQSAGLASSDQTDEPEPDKPARRTNKKLSKDRYFSFLGLVIFIVLIMLAAAFAKYGDSDS